jgi:RNA polymerase sigma-70 factor, ECF subfamily
MAWPSADRLADEHAARPDGRDDGRQRDERDAGFGAPGAGRRRDDREAGFDGLYDEHQRTLHAFLLGRTGDPELALDLLQETFVRAWRNLDLLLALVPIRQRAWLFSTARNLVVDQYRSRATRTAAHEALVATLEPGDQLADGPERVVERDRELRLVDEAIRRLPEQLRTVLVLQVLDERTSAEIGELLDRPAGTVRYQISQARKRLAEELRLLEAAPDLAHDAVPVQQASSSPPGYQDSISALSPQEV